VGVIPLLFYEGCMKDRIKEMTNQIAEKMGIIIEEIIINNNVNNIKIIADKKEGIKLDDLTNFSHTLSNDEKFENIIGNKYRFEVTSPGLDSKMTKPYQFIRNIGRNVNIFFDDQNMKSSIKGKIIEADDEKILIESKNKKKKNIVEINYNRIKHGKLKLKW
jgi:ribosome maturation factor RimP